MTFTRLIIIPFLAFLVSYGALQINPFSPDLNEKDYPSNVAEGLCNIDPTINVDVGDYVIEGQRLFSYLIDPKASARDKAKISDVNERAKSLYNGTVSSKKTSFNGKGSCITVAVLTDIQTYEDSQILSMTDDFFNNDHLMDRSISFMRLSLHHSGFFDNGYKSIFFLSTIFLICLLPVVHFPVLVYNLLPKGGIKKDKRFKTGFKNNVIPEPIKPISLPPWLGEFATSCYLIGFLAYFIISVVLIFTYGLSFEILLGLFLVHLVFLTFSALMVWIGLPMMLILWGL